MELRLEELAALNALGMLESDEKRVLSGAGQADKELRALEQELAALGAELGLLVEPVDPPTDMKKRIRAAIRAQSGGLLPSLSAGTVIAVLGWVLAAAASAVSVWLWQDRAVLSSELAKASHAISLVVPAADASKGKAMTLEEELNKLRQEVDRKESALNTQIESLRTSEGEARDQVAKLMAEAEAAKKRDAETQWQIAMLSTDVWEYRKGTMTVVWDGLRGHGVLMLDKMTRLEPGQDYQLWVVAAKTQAAVSAGVIPVNDKGGFAGGFKPAEPVTGEVNFILSVEAKGGATKPGSTKIFSGS